MKWRCNRIHWTCQGYVGPCSECDFLEDDMPDDDLKRKDDHLGQHAALCLVETGIEVDVDGDGLVCVNLDATSQIQTPDSVKTLTFFQARLLSDALLEAAFRAEGK